MPDKGKSRASDMDDILNHAGSEDGTASQNHQSNQATPRSEHTAVGRPANASTTLRSARRSERNAERALQASQQTTDDSATAASTSNVASAPGRRKRNRTANGGQISDSSDPSGRVPTRAPHRKYYRFAGQKIVNDMRHENDTWTAEQTAILFRERGQGNPYTVVAAILGRTELACRLHLHQTKERRKRAEKRKRAEEAGECPDSPPPPKRRKAAAKPRGKGKQSRARGGGAAARGGRVANHRNPAGQSSAPVQEPHRQHGYVPSSDNNAGDQELRQNARDTQSSQTTQTVPLRAQGAIESTTASGPVYMTAPDTTYMPVEPRPRATALELLARASFLASRSPDSRPPSQSVPPRLSPTEHTHVPVAASEVPSTRPAPARPAQAQVEAARRTSDLPTFTAGELSTMFEPQAVSVTTASRFRNPTASAGEAHTVFEPEPVEATTAARFRPFDLVHRSRPGTEFTLAHRPRPEVPGLARMQDPHEARNMALVLQYQFHEDAIRRSEERRRSEGDERRRRERDAQGRHHTH